MTLAHRCLSYTTFGLTYLATGLNPFWFHVGNVLCHGLAVLACFLFLDRLFESVRRQVPNRLEGMAPDRDRLLSFCGAALFAVHPISVYGAAYLTQRSIVLATLFSLLSLTAFLRALSAEPGQWRWLCLSVLLYGAALLSKEHAVMLPAVALSIVVLLGKRLPRSGRARWIIAATFAAIAPILVATVLRYKGVIGSVYEPYIRELSALKEAGVITLDPANAYAVSLVTQAGLFFKYMLLWMMPWPGWMSVDMREAIADAPLAWPFVLAIPAFVAWGCVAFALILRRGTSGLLGFALIFPWLMFFTEFATARIQEPFVLYRSYLWMPGLAAALPLLTRRLSARTIIIGCAALALVFTLAMRERLATFESNLTLWDDVVRKNTDTGRIFVDRGYGNRAVALLREDRLDEALRDLDTTLRLNPQSSHAWFNRGTVSSRRGDSEKALADFDRAIERDPGFAEAYAERCATLLKMDNPAPALESCEKALTLAPNLPNALLNRAVLHARAYRMQAALDDLGHVLRFEPDNGIALFYRGRIYRQTGREAEARENLNGACIAGVSPACAAVHPPGVVR
jgi:tetratricopeptide (TPR) repeat protein